MLIFVLVLVYYGVRCETLLDGNLTVAGLFTIQNSVGFLRVSSTNKTDCQDIAEILLKVALNIIALTLIIIDIYTSYP
jgi:hypothetical protein